ncbi:uncharacterized protein LOC116343432 [Contarinia nasturtii]|uniref:uncharacterized protein LOC116343432 n=1 Tax=Contarinia nasturtii TaxID=265458 RepID=UPI0012D402F5|nr:uncharacterized protein LOC116343432 [Contarinia nasturtii]XP_031627336.1 uncharacterized protein LOC116343432 [Contarinia nasturtii]XP_031627337.1 uncharacterized protein LOC116343432 [Contarinia nasturtii]
MESTAAVVLLFLCVAHIAEISAKTNTAGINDSGSLNSDFNELSSNELSTEIDNCREACLQKFSLDAATCSEAPVCIECWETCKSISSHQQAIGQNQWQLRIASMIKQEFLVATHLAWEPTNQLINCLVTWEVFGGGLMGNLLTDSANVELSLWPDTKYKVQVTCKNKDSGITVKSYPLTVDTTQAIKMKPESSSSETEDGPNELSTNEDQQWLNNGPNYHRTYISIHDAEYRYKSLMLGMCAGIIAFLFILTVFCASRRNDDKTRDSHPEQMNSGLLNEVITIRS